LSFFISFYLIKPFVCLVKSFFFALFFPLVFYFLLINFLFIIDLF